MIYCVQKAVHGSSMQGLPDAEPFKLLGAAWQCICQASCWHNRETDLVSPLPMLASVVRSKLEKVYSTTW